MISEKSNCWTLQNPEWRQLNLSKEFVAFLHTSGQNSLLISTSQDSIPAALTRDKKRIDGHDIAVYLAWQSTLYVTNFPEKADDAFIRGLFEPVIILPFIFTND